MEESIALNEKRNKWNFERGSVVKIREKDKFKKPVTYPRDDHAIIKQEYWDHAIEKVRNIE